MSEHDTADWRKYITLMIPQELQIIRRLESGERQSVVIASYNIGSSTRSDIRKQKGQLQLVVT
jgi:hypothetical protein